MVFWSVSPMPPPLPTAPSTFSSRCRARGLPTAHAGLAAGPLIVREGDVFGRTVNLAARVADVTPDGRLYAPEDVGRDLDPERFSVTAARQSILQGIGSVAVVDVTRPGVSPPP